MREDSIHRAQLLAQLPALVVAMTSDAAGLERLRQAVVEASDRPADDGECRESTRRRGGVQMESPRDCEDWKPAASAATSPPVCPSPLPEQPRDNEEVPERWDGLE
jgi:hypothetical protein